MIRSAIAVALLVLFCASAHAQDSDSTPGIAGDIKPGTSPDAPGSAAPGTAGDIQASTSPDAPGSVAPAPADCHGPLYYRLKEQDRQNRQAEADVGVMEAFVQRAPDALFPAQREELELKLGAQRKAHSSCLEDNPRPATICLAMARRDASLCQFQPSKERQEWCHHMLLVHEGVTTRSVKPCSSIVLDAERALCQFVVGGEFNCKQLAGEMGGVCEALAAGVASSPLPAAMSDDGMTAVQWIVAIKRQETAACEVLAESSDRTACLALLKADVGVCPPVRPLDEFIDEDFACRKPLVYKAEHPAAWGNMVALTVASAIRGPGQCEVHLDLLEDGRKRTMKAGDAALDRNGKYKHFHIFTGKGRLIDVRVSCQWEPPEEPPGGDPG